MNEYRAKCLSRPTIFPVGYRFANTFNSILFKSHETIFEGNLEVNCICVVHMYESDCKSRTFICINPKDSQETWIEVGQKPERAFKSMLRTSGYTAKTAHEVWNWYNFPVEKGKIVQKEIDHHPKDFVKQNINNPADNTLVRTRNH